MNTVTIGLEEYLELRKLQDAVVDKSVVISYWYNDNLRYYMWQVFTDNEEIEKLLQTNKELAEAIVAQSKLIQPPKKNWWKL